MFTRGFSFGMVPPLEGVAYSLTVGVARGIFRQMMSIGNGVKKSRSGRPYEKTGRERERRLEPPFSAQSSKFQYPATRTALTFASAPPQLVAAGGIPARFRWAPSPAVPWSAPGLPRLA